MRSTGGVERGWGYDRLIDFHALLPTLNARIHKNVQVFEVQNEVIEMERIFLDQLDKPEEINENKARQIAINVLPSSVTEVHSRSA
jgi:hypothetical protein